MEQVHLKRRLTAVMLADVVSYSRLMSVDEEGTHARLANHIKELIEPKVAEYSGRLIRTMGDGLLAEFDSAVDAVRCGVDIQRRLADHNREVDVERQIQLRIGINTGDVIVDGGDIYGNSINIAARLEALAEPGEVYVTESVYDQMRGHPSLSFEDKGARQVKNIDHPIHVFRVEHGQREPPRLASRNLVAAGRQRLAGMFAKTPRLRAFMAYLLVISAALMTASFAVWNDHPGVASKASIVVLPFVNLSGDPEQEYFADAVSDDLTTDLSRLSQVFVIARGTAFTYKGKAADVKQIGRDLGVRYVLEGSIRRVGTRVQTNAQLIDTRSGAHVWADRFDNEVTNLLELQHAVIGRIATSLDLQLVKAENRRSLEERPTSPDAVDLRLRGLALMIEALTPEHMLAARRYFDESVRLDTQSADTWSWLATALASDYLNHWNNAGKEELDRAETAVERALALDPSHPQAHFAAAFVYRAKGEQQAALAAFDRAIAFNPNFARAYAQKGNQLINVGRPGEAPPLVQKAIELSPRDPSLGVFYWIIGRANFFSGHYKDAIPWLEKSIQIRANLWYTWLFLVSARYHIGQQEEAKALLIDFHQRFPDYTLARLVKIAKLFPNDNPVVLAGLEEFYDGLRRAGMAER